MTERISQEVLDAIEIVSEAVRESGVQLPAGAPSQLSWHFVAGMIASHYEFMENIRAQVADLQDMIGYASIHLDDERRIVSSLTTEHKELWADAVDAWHSRLYDEDDEVTPYDRWWRNT